MSVNGTTPHDDDDENKRAASADDQPNSAEASINGGSDTEASRTGLKDGDRGHNRSASSVKKPATFKAVSVNKTFLASKASPSNGTAKPTDKPRAGTGTPPPGSSSLTASKPRLIAKTGTQANPRASLANGGKPASAPDPNVVWNKNRRVLTLTKPRISLSHRTNKADVATPVPDPKKMTDEDLKKYGIHMASRLEEDETQGQSKWADLDDDDDDWAPEAITWTDGTKTTLPHPDEAPPPPVVNPQSLARDPVPEKPQSPAPPASTSTLMVKPAGLPSGRGLKLKSTPQDKPTLVAKPPTTQPAKSPWATLPPVDRASPVAVEPSNASRGPGKDHLSQRGTGPAGSLPPPPREFAPDDFSRSTGWRDGASNAGRELYNSQSGRYEPAFERRGSFRHDQAKQPHLLQRPSQSDHPEPSSAFQTHRTSHDSHFGRRRASSNVSGGSGAYFRMMKGSDGGQMPPDMDLRRPSIAGSVESAASPSAVPAVLHGQGRFQQGQPGWGAHVSPQAQFAHPAHAGPPGPDMVPQPPQPPAQPGVDEVEYQKNLMKERTQIARQRRQNQEAAEEAARKERIARKLEAMGPPPKKKSDKADVPPAEPVRPTHIQQRDEASPASSSAEAATQNRTGSADQESPASVSAQETAASDSTKPGVEPPSSNRRMSQTHGSKPPGSWNGSGPRPDRFNWPATGPRGNNVWGNDRGLGNGTFNPDLVHVPGAAANPAGKGPSPIAPPSSARPPPPEQAPPHQQAPIGSRSRFGQQSDLANQWVSAVRDGDEKLNAARLSERQEREQKLAERGLTPKDIQPVIKDTWRQVHVPGDGTRRQVPSTDSSAHQPSPWQAPGEDLPSTSSKDASPVPHPGVIGSGSNAILQSKQGTPSQPRTSRFFPSRDVRVENQTLPVLSRPQSPSPPPPTMEDHPVYEGNVKHPHVSLPRPHPVVKLPPAMAPPAGQHSRANGNVAAPASFKDTGRSGSQSHSTARRASEVSEKNWQQRFDNLFHSAKYSPPKAMGVDPASRNALDDAVHRDAATVSLPGRSLPPVLVATHEATTKPMAEECFDEPEIGSLPQVRVPHKAPEALWEPVNLDVKPLHKRLNIRAFAVEPFWPFEAPGNTVIFHFPGMDQAKTITLPASATRSGRGSRGGRSRGTRGGNRRENSRTREPKESSSSGSRGNGRGNYRGRGSENWNSTKAAQQPLPA